MPDNNTTIASNPTPSYTFGDIFNKIVDTSATLGGNYLTLQGQLAIQKQNADAQARLNGYSAVNPSLGAVNPGAAMKSANQSLVSRWLPGGSPVVGTPGTGATISSEIPEWVKWAVLAVGAVLAFFLLRMLFRAVKS